MFPQIYLVRQLVLCSPWIFNSIFLILDEPTSLYPERFVVQSLLLLKSTMGDWASASPIDVSADFVRQFAELLVTRLLPLRTADLEKWSEDPEEWMNEEEADRWEYELRVSSICDLLW